MSTNLYRSAATGRFTESPATKTKKIHHELYRAFDYFNKTFADGKLPKPVITVQESGRRNAYGWFGKGFWYDNEMKESVPEINLSAEYLARGPHGLLETLLHEMAHFYNAINGVRDCTSGQYHNKHFKKAAEMFGLNVKRSINRGYSVTSLTEVSEKAIDELKVDESLFKNVYRRPQGRIQEKRYISLVVDAALEGVLASAVGQSSLSQKEFVERALHNEIDNVLAKLPRYTD